MFTSVCPPTPTPVFELKITLIYFTQNILIGNSSTDRVPLLFKFLLKLKKSAVSTRESVHQAHGDNTA